MDIQDPPELRVARAQHVEPHHEAGPADARRVAPEETRPAIQVSLR